MSPGIPTKNRYDTLALTLQSVTLQTVEPDSVIIVDDSDQPTRLRTLPAYQSVFQLLDVYGIGWQVVYGRKLGQPIPSFGSMMRSCSSPSWSNGGINCEPTKIMVLDCGRGDHVLVKSLLSRLKEKYKKLIVATCYPDFFNGEIEQISIAEAHQRFGNLDRFSIYRWAIDHNWRRELVGAYEEMLGLC